MLWYEHEHMARIYLLLTWIFRMAAGNRRG